MEEKIYNLCCTAALIYVNYSFFLSCKNKKITGVPFTRLFIGDYWLPLYRYKCGCFYSCTKRM